MKIYFNGDSHTCGAELRDPKETAYSYRIANKLNATVMDNPAVGGAGNDRILRLTNNFLDNCEKTMNFPDLVIIGWSETSRFDWFVNGRYRTYGSGEDGLLAELGRTIDPVRAEYHEKHLTSLLTLLGAVRYQHNQMFDLHLRLKHLKIKHLFFNAVHSFNNLLSNPHYKGILSAIHYETEMNESTKLPALDWEGSFWKPYEHNGSFLAWGEVRDFHITPYFHLEAAAHDTFSDELIDYMRVQNIIKR